jgi:DNA repair protein RadC
MKAIFMQKLFLKKVNSTFCNVDRVLNSKEAYMIAQTIWEADTIAYTESFYVVYLNQNNRPLCYALISTGGIAGVYVDIRVVLAHAFQSAATSIILFHNHPSGNLGASTEDIKLTDKIKSACQVCDLKLQDHIILSPEGNFYSFMDNGLI